MKTPKKRRQKEAARKRDRKAKMRPFLQQMKQVLYHQRTGKWEFDVEKLHWHHKYPELKTRKLAHLTTRSLLRVAEELRHCEVLHVKEHLKLHHCSELRSK